MKCCIAGLMLLVFVPYGAAEGAASGVLPGATPGELREYETLVLENNPELYSLREQLADLEESYGQFLLISDSGVTVAGGYAYAPQAAQGPDVPLPHAFSGSASVNIPLLPQVSLALQVSTAGEASLSVNLLPLAGLNGNIAIEEQLANLRLAITYKRKQLKWQSRMKLLQYAAANKNLIEAAVFLENKEIAFEGAEKRFKEGFISAFELRSSADALAGSSIDFLNANQEKTEAEKNLFLLCGLGALPTTIVTYEIPIVDILTLISEAHNEYMALSGAETATSEARQALELSKYFLEKQLKGTWAVEPEISLSLSGSIADVFGTASESAAAGVSLQLSGDSFNIDEIKEFREEIADVDRDLLLSRIVFSIDLRNMEAGYESARVSAEIAERYLTTMDEALEQAILELERDDISENEYLDIRHNRNLAEIGYLNSLISVYEQAGSLLQFYDASEDGDS